MAETIAVVGGETLLGRELREVLGETVLGQHVRLVAAAEEESGTLTEIGGSAAFLAKLDPDAVGDAEALILAGSVEDLRRRLRWRQIPVDLVVDLTYAAEDNPDARIRAPQVERADGADYEIDHTGPQIVAHPAATAIAMVLQRLNVNYRIARAIVHIFEPASEYGTAGIEELQQQTVVRDLLSFQPVPKKVFDSQLAYAMLAQLGSGRACSAGWTRKTVSSGTWQVCWSVWTAFRCRRCD